MLIVVWLVAALGTVTVYSLTALVVDGRVDFGTWVMSGLVFAILLGPAGAVLTLVLTGSTLWTLRREEWWLLKTYRRLAVRLKRKGQLAMRHRRARLAQTT
jgi:hypothetical protein